MAAANSTANVATRELDATTCELRASLLAALEGRAVLRGRVSQGHDASNGLLTVLALAWLPPVMEVEVAETTVPVEDETWLSEPVEVGTTTATELS